MSGIKSQTSNIKHQTSNYKSQLPLVIVWLLILAFVIAFATLSLRRHAALGTNGLDLGNIDQALWNTARGDFLAFTNMTHIAPVRNRLALHVEPILLLFVPFYWIGFGGPELLIVVQAAVVGLGALPLYLLARDALTSSGEIKNSDSLLPMSVSLLLIVFPLAYLLLPALEAAVMYDFHPLALAATFLLFAFYFLEKGRPWIFGFFAVLAIATKEDMGLTVAMLGLYALIAHRRWRLGGVTMLVGAVWFVLAVFVIQPKFNPIGGNIQANRYAWLGETPQAIIGTLLLRPGLVWEHVWHKANLPGYLGGLFLPTAFLSLFSPLVWLPTLPSFAVNLLSDNPFTWRLEDFHYAAPIAPFVLIATVFGVQYLVRLASHRSHTLGRYILIVACSLLLVASLAYHYVRGFSPLARPFQPWPITDHQRRAEDVFDQVSPAAAVFAQDNLNPHVSGRRVLYQGPVLLTDPTLLSGLPAPDLLLFDVSSLVNQDDFHRFIASELISDEVFGPVVADDGFLLLERGAPALPLGDEFYDFVRAAPNDIAYPLVTDFGDVLRLHGFDLIFNRAEEVKVVLYLEALQVLDEDYFLSLYLLDQWGNPLGATVEDQPALAWYPTHRWQPGELVKVTFNTVPWYTRDLLSYRMAVGVMSGRDPWQPAARVTPNLHAEDATSYAVRTPEGGSLLELARFHQVFGMPAGGPVEREFRRPRLQTALEVSLGGEVRLLGYDISPIRCAAPSAVDNVTALQGSDTDGCWLGLVLYWQAEQKMDTDYTVFVHAVGPDGEIWAQRDTPPDSGSYPTSRWAVGEVIADPIRVPLPPEIPPSPLEVVVGMYHPGTSQRLPVRNAEGQPVGDNVVLGPVLVDK